VDVAVLELLRMTVALSDNAAADMLLRLAGGPEAVSRYMASIGVKGFHLEDGEHALHRDVSAQYRNWFEPAGAIQLLRAMVEHSPLTPAYTELAIAWMQSSVRGGRLNGDLPPGTPFAHKAGSSGVDEGLAHATNDIGLIILPDRRVLAIAVFITDSRADDATRDKVIARIGRAIYDAALRG
jgi:beta-lactamase class A